MRPMILTLALLTGCYEETDMTFRDDIPEWASGTVNKTTPTPGEIALGHLNGTEADSSWVNERSGVRDVGINAANEASQAASTWYPTDAGDDRTRLAAELQHSKEYSTSDPDSPLCRLDIANDVHEAVPGWNYDTDRAAVYMTMSGDTASIYRVDTWDVGGLTLETLDLDLTYVSYIIDIVSDGESIYIAYLNSNTSNFHIAQLSLTAWTGLAVSDLDTGWGGNYVGSFIRVTIPRPGTVGAFYHDAGTPSAEFGIWTVGTSWVTGAGNLGGVTGSHVATQRFARLQSNHDAIFTTTKTDYLTCSDFLVAADVSNPANAGSAPDAVFLFSSASTAEIVNHTVVRPFKDYILYINPDGEIVVRYDDGTPGWGLIGLWNLSDVGVDRSSEAHRGEVVADGNGRLWMQYRLDAGHTNSGETVLTAIAYPSMIFGPSAPNFVSYPPSAVVSLASTDVQDTSIQWMMSDGRNLVSIERVGSGADTSVLRVMTSPGVR